MSFAKLFLSCPPAVGAVPRSSSTRSGALKCSLFTRGTACFRYFGLLLCFAVAVPFDMGAMAFGSLNLVVPFAGITIIRRH